MNESHEFEDARRREAADPHTAPHRLIEIAHDYSRFAMLHVAPLVASNPNAPFDLLCELVGRFPREVLANPVLQLLYIEDPRQFAEMPVKAALMLLREE